MRGSERNQSNQPESVAGYTFHIHYRADLLADDVIVWNGNQYNIRFIADEGMGSVYLMIEAERGVAV
jgi:SPP1 family predicted phage head-tail adaptor